jgi:hypothetical protein
VGGRKPGVADDALEPHMAYIVAFSFPVLPDHHYGPSQVPDALPRFPQPGNVVIYSRNRRKDLAFKNPYVRAILCLLNLGGSGSHYMRMWRIGGTKF